jgi:hypothetical protein
MAATVVTRGAEVERIKPERDTETSRPIRLWDAGARAQLRWRYYVDPKRAIQGALNETHWSPRVLRHIEIHNVRGGKHLGTFHKDATGRIIWTPPDR